MPDDLDGYRRSYTRVPGWLSPLDFLTIEAVLAWQDELGVMGDVLEIGVYLGKSAILIGHFVRPDELFSVCDLFGAAAPEESNSAENERTYPGLMRSSFEQNYSRYASDKRAPRILEMPSTELGAHVSARPLRFAHVDGSHLYDVVAEDLQLVRNLLVPSGGVVVCDDFRAPHTPGVAAAVWSAVARGHLHPVAITDNKFIGALQDLPELQDSLTRAAAAAGYGVDAQRIMGHEVLRFYRQPSRLRALVAGALPAAVLARKRGL